MKLTKLSLIVLAFLSIIPLLSQDFDDARRQRGRWVTNLDRGRPGKLGLGERIGPRLEEVRLRKELSTSRQTKLQAFEVDERGNHIKDLGEITLTETAVQAEAPEGNPERPPTAGQILGTFTLHNRARTLELTVMPYIARIDGKWEAALLDPEGKVVSVDVELEGHLEEMEQKLQDLKKAIQNEEDLQHSDEPAGPPKITGHSSCLQYRCWWWCGPWWAPWSKTCEGWCTLFCWPDWSQHLHQSVRDIGGGRVEITAEVVQDSNHARIAAASLIGNAGAALTQVTP